MHIRKAAIFVSLVTSLLAHAAPALKLVPYPKSVAMRDEHPFPVSAATRIVIASPAYRTAAETLAEEIERVTGTKPRIVAGRAPAANAIYLTRTTDAAAKSLTKDATLGEEGYVLRATASRVIAAGASEVGTFYGVQTLRQLIVPAAKKRGNIPALDVRDWPSMRWRGIHDDISRGPIPTMDYMKRQIRTAAEFKMNLFSLYMEHVFAYKSVPVAAPEEAAITPEQIKELVAYAKKYYVTLLPEQQAFGHLHHMLKYEMYNDVAETPHGHVLAPVHPRTYELISKMYSELVPLFPGPLLHIGADETWELGQGQTAALAKQEGIGRVYLAHLKKVSEMMRP